MQVVCVDGGAWQDDRMVAVSQTSGTGSDPENTFNSVVRTITIQPGTLLISNNLSSLTSEFYIYLMIFDFVILQCMYLFW